MYADDTQTYKHCFYKDLNETVTQLQNCFDALNQWMSSNRLKLNAEKTDIITFGSKHWLSKVPINTISLNGIPITISTSVRNLGFILDAELNFSKHSSHLTSSCFFQLRQLWQIRACLTQASCEILVHAFISSQLDYCNAVFAGCNKSVLKSIQLIQNAAARLVCRKRKWEHISPVLHDLHWLPVADRLTFKVAIHVFNSIHGLNPPYLYLPALAEVPGRRALRSSDRGDLIVPRSFTATYGPKTFFYSGPKIWNSLPSDLRSIPDLSSFKHKLKFYLFSSLTTTH